MALSVVASTQFRTVLVYVRLDDGSATVTMTPDEARRHAAELVKAAEVAEPVIPRNGLGTVTARLRAHKPEGV